MSSDIMLRSPNIERVDTIEIEPAMVDGARAFLPRVQLAYSDPRSHIVIDDAKSYFARGGRKRYDIIVSEPSNPWVSGVASLFTEEFYRASPLSLNDGGVLSQWLHTYEMDSAGMASVFKAVAKTFPQFVVYTSNDGDIILIARKGAPVGRMDPRALGWPKMRPVVERLHIADPAVLLRAMRERAPGHGAGAFRLGGRPRQFRLPARAGAASLETRFTQERVTDLDEHAGHRPAAAGDVRRQGRAARPQDPSPVETAGVDHVVVDAWFFHDLLLSPALVPTGPRLRRPRASSRRASSRCGPQPVPPSVPFDRLLPSIVTIAEAVNPHLAKEAALEVWKRLEGTPCASRLAPGDRRWLELFSAVAGRDPAAMSRVGDEILEANRGRRDILTEYAFGATAAGLVCQHRLADANKLFAAGTKDWLLAGAAPVGLRYLYTLANLPDASQWPRGAACGAPAPSS